VPLVSHLDDEAGVGRARLLGRTLEETLAAGSAGIIYLEMETWRCFDRTEVNRTNVLLTLTRLDSAGGVSVAGKTHTAEFEVQGLNRRWDFSPDDNGSYDYMFLIEPDGTALYYDFSRSADGTAKASQIYQCEVPADR